jgi:hypothetical protein
MNSNTVSRTGYAVRTKPLVLLASVTFQDNGENVLVREEYL